MESATQGKSQEKAMSEIFSGRNIERERSDVYKQIEKNKANFVAAEEEIKRLQAESVELKRRLNKATSFINNLPEDILAELFYDLCGGHDVPPTILAMPPQLLIGSVCHHWREIAWRTHGLWRQIFIFFREQHFDTQKVLLEEWLERSGGYAVNMSLYSIKDFEPPSGAFDKLMESCGRWESLSIFPFKSFSSALETGPTHQFSSLKSLHIDFKDKSNRGPPLLKFNNPPKLELLNVHFTPRSGSTLELDWGTLTFLRAADITLQLPTTDPITINTLFSCTSLTKLELTLMEENEELDLTHLPGSLHLSKLQELTLGLEWDSWVDPLIQFLNLITVPSLESLSLRTIAPGEGDGEWVDPLLNLARRSSFKLRQLSLEVDEPSDTGVRTLLQQLSPSNPIRSLRISSDLSTSFKLSKELLAQMTINPEDNAVRQKECLPMLSSFSYVGDISCSLNSLTRFMKSRSAHIQNRMDDGSADVAFFINIQYNNRGWIGDQNPNAIQVFYRDVEELSKQGVHFNLEWNTHQAQNVNEDD